MIKPFLNKCLDGECGPEHIDDYIDFWHDNTLEADFIPLHEFLGMSEDEYGKWLSNTLRLEQIIEGRKNESQK